MQGIQQHMGKLLAIILGIWLMTASTIGSAEVYKTVDERGKVIFTDQPSPGAEAVEVKEPNTSKPIVARDYKTKTGKEAAEYGVAITSPSDDQVFANRLAPFTVTTLVTPRLEQNHRLRLKIDDAVHSIEMAQFTVRQLSLGKHRLVVEIIDAEGNVITQSKAITIYSRQPG